MTVCGCSSTGCLSTITRAGLDGSAVDQHLIARLEPVVERLDAAVAAGSQLVARGRASPPGPSRTASPTCAALSRTAPAALLGDVRRASGCAAVRLTLRLGVAGAGGAGRDAAHEPCDTLHHARLRRALDRHVDQLGTAACRAAAGARPGVVPVATPAALMTGAENARRATRPVPSTASLIASAEPSTRSKRSRSERAVVHRRAGLVGARHAARPAAAGSRCATTRPRRAAPCNVSSTRTSTTTSAANPIAHSTAASVTASSPALIDLRRAGRIGSVGGRCAAHPFGDLLFEAVPTRLVPAPVGQTVRQVLLGDPTASVVMRVLVARRRGRAMAAPW